jgi:hypothetical protein
MSVFILHPYAPRDEALDAKTASVGWWALVDSNHRPPPCEGGALTN